jgi:hypothetical protein
MAVKIFVLLLTFFNVQALFINLLYGQEINNTQRFKTGRLHEIDTLQVSVDDHKISMYVSGTGKYTVILEAGGASNTCAGGVLIAKSQR